jgi:hypothetical protein
MVDIAHSSGEHHCTLLVSLLICRRAAVPGFAIHELAHTHPRTLKFSLSNFQCPTNAMSKGEDYYECI